MFCSALDIIAFWCHWRVQYEICLYGPWHSPCSGREETRVCLLTYFVQYRTHVANYVHPKACKLRATNDILHMTFNINDLETNWWDLTPLFYSAMSAPRNKWLGAYEIGQVVKYIVSTVQPMPTVSRSKPNGCTVVATVDSLIGKWATLDVQPKLATDWRPVLGS